MAGPRALPICSTRAHEVELFERDTRPGGHVNTVAHRRARGSTPASSSTTSATTRASRAVRASSASRRRTRRCRSRSPAAAAALECSGRRPFAQARNAAEPALPALPARGQPLAANGRDARWTTADGDCRLGRTSTRRGYSRAVPHALPRAAYLGALVDARPSAALDFPAALRDPFFDHHGMLGFGRFRWRTVTGGSRSYVRALLRAAPRPAAPRARRPRSSGATPTASTLRDRGRRDAPLRQGRGRDPRRPGARAAGRRDRRGAARARRLPLHGERDRAAHRRALPAAAPWRPRVLELPAWTAALEGPPTITYYLNRLQRLDGGRGLLRDAEPQPRDRPRARDRAHRSTTTRSTRSTALAAQRELAGAQRGRPHASTPARITATASTRTGSPRASAPPRALGVEW